jgi:hypothetical protein
MYTDCRSGIPPSPPAPKQPPEVMKRWTSDWKSLLCRSFSQVAPCTSWWYDTRWACYYRAELFLGSTLSFYCRILRIAALLQHFEAGPSRTSYGPTLTSSMLGFIQVCLGSNRASSAVTTQTTLHSGDLFLFPSRSLQTWILPGDASVMRFWLHREIMNPNGSNVACPLSDKIGRQRNIYLGLILSPVANIF